MYLLKTPTNNKGENPLLTHTPPSATRSQRSKLFKTFSGSKVFKGEQKKESVSSLRLDTSSIKNSLSNKRQSTVTHDKLGLRIGTTPTDATFPAGFDSISEELNRHSKARNLDHGYSKKSHIPTPLNLEMLSPPPSNYKAKEMFPRFLEKLPHLRKSDAVVTKGPSKQNLGYLNLPIESFHDQKADLLKRNPRRNLLNSVEFREAADLETTDEKTPDFAENVYKNIETKGLITGMSSSSNLERKKNYTMNICFICDEALNSLLPGEKVLEMSCSHQCHYDCLLASLEGSSAFGERNLEYPACSICQQTSKPTEQEINDTLVRDLLLTSMNNDVLSDLNNFHVSRSSSSNLKQQKKTPITPTGQLIAAQKVTQHGYMKTPIKEHHDLTKRDLGQPNQQFHGSMIPKPVFSVNPQASTINVSLNSNKPLVIPHVLYVHLPDISKTKAVEQNRENALLRLDNLETQQKFSKLVLEEFFPTYSQNTTTASNNLKKENHEILQMIDLMEVSLDDVNYSEWLLVMFENKIILKSLKTNKSARNLQMGSLSSQVINISNKEIYSIMKCKDKTFVSLKSSQIPELYMKNTENPIVLNKWTVVMEYKLGTKSANNDDKISHFDKSGLNLSFLHFTTNAFNLMQERGLLVYFPASLHAQITLYLNDPILCHNLIPKFESESIKDPLKNDSSEVPATACKNGRVQVLVINVLNYDTLVNSTEMCQDIKTMVENFLNAAGKNDQIGIIVFGRDSENKMNLNEGTFLGMINNKWGGIAEFLKNLKVFDCFHVSRTYSEQERELLKITEITKRLFIMNNLFDARFSTNNVCYKKHIHIVSNSYNGTVSKDPQENQIEISRSFRKFVSDYKLDISLYSIGAIHASLLENIMEQHFEFDSRYRCFNYSRQGEIEFCKNSNSQIDDLMIDIKLKDNKNGFFKFHCLENSFGHKVQIENNENLPAVRVNLGAFARGTFKTYLLDLIIVNPKEFYKENCLKIENKGLIDVFADDSSIICRNSDGNFKHTQSFIEFSTNWVDKDYGLINGDIYDSGKILINFYGISDFIKPMTDYHPFLNDTELLENDEDTEFLDIVLTAPLTSSRDSIYVLREIEMMIIEVMEAHLRCFARLNWQDMEHDFKQLYSVTFAMSRNIQIEFPSFNSYMAKFQVHNKYLTNYIEYLCRMIDDIFVFHGSSSRPLPGQEELSKFKLVRLLNNLKFQNRHNI